MSRYYSSLSVHFFDDHEVQELSLEGRMLMLYLLTCKHINMAGYCRFSPSYAVVDLGLSEERVNSALDKLNEVGLINFIAGADLMFITKWFQHNPIRTLSAVNDLIELDKSGGIPEERLLDTPDPFQLIHEQIVDNAGTEDWDKAIGYFKLRFEQHSRGTGGF